MTNDRKKVLIVGGGSAGWMAAAYLSKALGDNVRVSLVESANVSTVGVGEATFSTIKLFFDYLGLEEHDWMPQCNATYKMAIKFVDWNQEGRHFYHPFQRYEVVDGFNVAEWWLKLKRGREPFDYACFTVPAICDDKKSPRFLDGRVFDYRAQDYFASQSTIQRNMLTEHRVQFPYAYHFNASHLAEFMREYATARGVKRIVDDVLNVVLQPEGGVSHIITRDHGEIHADLFVDCTGFRGVLINQALKEPFISFSESLLCDKAIAMQIPKDTAAEGIKPYTTATALSAGWVWNIPLISRDGSGYVYSSAFISQDEAEREFRRHLGPISDGCKPLHITMRVGRNRNSWVKNCVAIGLSSGFVEPLESTGIFFIQNGIEELVKHFPGEQLDEQMIKSYNHAVAACIDGVREFLTLHYRASARADTPFWQATKHDLKIPDALQERLALWKTRLPCNRSINARYHGFEAYSYSVMLLGLGYQPGESLPVLDHMDDRKAQALFQAINQRSHQLCQSLPSHYEYLLSLSEKRDQRN
jgi:tryptophan halogenase